MTTIYNFPLALPPPALTCTEPSRSSLSSGPGAPVQKAHRRPKKSRGGQPGNHNASKHGLYSSDLTSEQQEEFRRIVSEEGLDPQLAFLRLKLMSVILNDPGVGLIVKWYGRNSDLSQEDARTMRRALLDALEPLSTKVINARFGRSQNESSAI